MSGTHGGFFPFLQSDFGDARVFCLSTATETVPRNLTMGTPINMNLYISFQQPTNQAQLFQIVNDDTLTLNTTAPLQKPFVVYAMATYELPNNNFDETLIRTDIIQVSNAGVETIINTCYSRHTTYGMSRSSICICAGGILSQGEGLRIKILSVEGSALASQISGSLLFIGQ